MKPQLLFTIGGAILLTLLLIFGRTATININPPHLESEKQSFNVLDYIGQAKSKLSSQQVLYVSKLEHSISRGDVKKQLYQNYMELSKFWKDSINSFIPYAYYLEEASKLDNSEKNLTFAAQIMLDSLRAEVNPKFKSWEAESGIALFQQAILLDPENDNLKIGLGSCYVYGKGMIGDPSETMKGIQQLLQVVRKDSNNMRAQLVLGVGGVVSHQYDKAIERLLKVVSFDGKNLEAVSWLADAYAAKNDKVNAKKWYEYSKKLVNNQEYNKAVDERINAL